MQLCNICAFLVCNWLLSFPEKKIENLFIYIMLSSRSEFKGFKFCWLVSWLVCRLVSCFVVLCDIASLKSQIPERAFRRVQEPELIVHSRLFHDNSHSYIMKCCRISSLMFALLEMSSSSWLMSFKFLSKWNSNCLIRSLADENYMILFARMTM